MRLALIVAIALAATGCRNFSFLGVRCESDNFCPPGLVCRTSPDAPDAGQYCQVPLAADAGAGADAGADASADAGVDAGSKTWGDAGPLDTAPPGLVSSPAVGLDSAGNAWAVWIRGDAGAGAIVSSQWGAPSSTWSSLTPVSNEDAPALQRPEIAVSPSGDAVAIWMQKGASYVDLWANRLSADGGRWGDAGLLELASTGDVKWPALATDGAGNAIVVWAQDPFGGVRIWARSYLATNGSWTETVDITGSYGGASYAPRVALNSAGDGVAIWTNGMGGDARVYANRYERDAGRWGDAGLLSFDAANSVGLGVAAGADGELMAIWRQGESPPMILYYKRMSAGATSWGDAGSVRTVNGSVDGFQVRAATPGNFIAVWVEITAGGNNVVQGRYLGAWTSGGLSNGIQSTDARNPSLAVDGNGNAFVAYELWNNTRWAAWMNQYDAAKDAWSTGSSMDLADAGTALAPRVASNASGRAVLLWSQENTAPDAGAIWARIYK